MVLSSLTTVSTGMSELLYLSRLPWIFLPAVGSPAGSP